MFNRNNTKIVSGISPKYPPLREEYNAQDCGRKYSNISINSASQVSPSPFGRVIPENPYGHSPNKRRPYVYAELNNSGKSDSNFSGFSKTASSFQVPLGSQKEASDSGNDGLFVNFELTPRFLLMRNSRRKSLEILCLMKKVMMKFQMKRRMLQK